MRRVSIGIFMLFLVACRGAVETTAPSIMPSSPESALPADTMIPTTFPSKTSMPGLVSPPFPEISPLPATLQEPTQLTVSPYPSVSYSQALEIPDGSLYTWRLVVNGLNKPVDLTHAGDGSGRLFVIEQEGLIRIIEDGALLATPYLDIRDQVSDDGSEQGLLGLAFHPLYPENGFYYINYTDLVGDTVIARFRVSSEDPNFSASDTETPLLQVPQPYGNHNGGGLKFGPDGYLYIGLGDGGSAGDPQGNGQSLDSLLGKMLRIDVNQGGSYAIPPDNPLTGGGGRPEIWASGLRNPWRFAFDRASGDLYIGDVGQNLWEEVDFLAAGSPGGTNFGWNYLEGTHPYSGNAPAGLILTPPVVEYDHELGCSVTGGIVYRGSRLPAWQGVYLFGDYCSGRVWGLLRDYQGFWKHAVLFEDLGWISSFGEDEHGEVYLVDHTGSIYTLDEK